MHLRSRLSLLTAIAGLVTFSAAAAPPAADYVAKAGAGDLYEIQSSKLVLASTGNAKLRTFAQQMVTDHTKSTAQVKTAATSAGLHPKPPALDAKKRTDIAALTSAKGEARDRLYLQQQQAAHQEALALHQDYAGTGDKPALKAVAGKIVPVVQHHAQMLGQMGGS